MFDVGLFYFAIAFTAVACLYAAVYGLQTLRILFSDWANDKYLEAKPNNDLCVTKAVKKFLMIRD